MSDSTYAAQGQDRIPPFGSPVNDSFDTMPGGGSSPPLASYLSAWQAIAVQAYDLAHVFHASKDIPIRPLDRTAQYIIACVFQPKAARCDLFHIHRVQGAADTHGIEALSVCHGSGPFLFCLSIYPL